MFFSAKQTLVSAVAVLTLLGSTLASTSAHATEQEAPGTSSETVNHSGIKSGNTEPGNTAPGNTEPGNTAPGNTVDPSIPAPTPTSGFNEEPTQLYIVTFDSAGGDAFFASANVAAGSTVPRPNNPNHLEGPVYIDKYTYTIHKFTGWYLNNQLYDFSTPVTADLTLKAGWRVMTVTCTCGPQRLNFRDVPDNHRFVTEINWMYTEKLTTGIKGTDGLYYAPKQELTREAMAAFMYRLKGSPAVTLPAESPFSDVNQSDKFYREIVWMQQQKLANGTKQLSGKPKFGPKEALTREAMAAFIYRLEGSPKFTMPKTSPLVDMQPGTRFRNEVMWMYESKLTTGIKQGTSRIYAPKSALSREAMAAFIYRLETQYHK